MSSADAPTRETDDPKARPHMFRRLYDWTLSWAHTPYGTPALFTIAFAESSFFPGPPDVLLIALSLGRRQRALFYALICSIGSTLGGMLGYWLGYAGWHLLERFFIPYLFSREVFDKVVEYYNAEAFWYVFLAAFTPIPYKVFTLAAGVCEIPFWILVASSLFGRSTRFFLVAGLLYWFGDAIRVWVEIYFDRLLWALLILGVAGFLAIKYL
jgi:membrane protein YqaA with SNARE-associated domain